MLNPKITKHYITDHWHFMLDENKKVRQTRDLYEWAAWMEADVKSGKKSNRIVKQTTLKNGLWVSTVFLGVDYNFGFGPDKRPILFETMIFDRKRRTKYKLGNTERLSMGEDVYQERYHTYEEAEKGHEEAIKKFTNYVRPRKKLNSA